MWTIPGRAVFSKDSGVLIEWPSAKHGWPGAALAPVPHTFLRWALATVRRWVESDSSPFSWASLELACNQDPVVARNVHTFWGQSQEVMYLLPGSLERLALGEGSPHVRSLTSQEDRGRDHMDTAVGWFAEVSLAPHLAQTSDVTWSCLGPTEQLVISATSSRKLSG